MTHNAVPYAADPFGHPASWRCVLCKKHWPAHTPPPDTCKENSTP